MKIVFLDYDGVLNYEKFYVGRDLSNLDEYPLCEICPVAVANLNRILKETGAKVVVSSTWRYGRTIGELQNILEQRGFSGEIIGATPIDNTRHHVRGNEILKWIQDNPLTTGEPVYFDYKEYVIIDDDEDMLYQQRNNFLQTSPFDGLTVEGADSAISILNYGHSN